MFLMPGDNALVDDYLFPRFAAFLPYHHRLIARLALLDDRSATLVAGTLTYRYASTNRSDADAIRASSAKATLAAKVSPAAMKISDGELSD
jgi:hypothetical protein